MNINTAEKWVRSSRCNWEGNCVELIRDHDRVIIRDSKHTAARLPFSAAPWASFVEHCRRVF